MKKIFLTLVVLVMSSSAIATHFIDGHQYVTLDKAVTGAPPILELFSFNCPHCYKFEQIYCFSKNVKKSLSVKTRIARYHIEFLGPLGKELTQAWAVAMALGIEEKVSMLMFETMQNIPSIKTADDICSVFIKAGVSKEDYNATLNSFAVKTLVCQQKQAAENLPLRGVPAILVNGKYMVNNEGLDSSSMDAYIKQFIDVVKFLSDKNTIQ